MADQDGQERSRTILLITFVKNHPFQRTAALQKIANNFDVSRDMVFILENVDNPAEVILSYNIQNVDEVRFKDVLRPTLQVHRKRDTNTIYTINALNHIGGQAEDGERKNVDWEAYKDQILLMRNGEFKTIKVNLVAVETVSKYRTFSGTKAAASQLRDL